MTLSHRKTTIIIFILVIFLFALPSFSLAGGKASEYAGAYAGDMVWDGTVTMTGDVLILDGGSLTIRPGTRVNVVPAEGTKIDPEYLSSQTELLVRGKLDILGTPDAPVRFVVKATSGGEEIAWAGITLDQAGPSRIHHVELARADIAVRCVASSPQIKGCKILGCRYGIVAQQQSHAEILDNLLVDGEGGIFCWNGSNPRLSGNTISGHDEEAIFVDAGSWPRLAHNTVSGNAIGLALYPGNLPFDAVTFSANTENIRFLGHQGQGGGQ